MSSANILAPLLPRADYKKVPAPKLSSSQRTAVAGYAGAVLDESMGISPSAVLAPNFVYGGGLCVTETLAVSTSGGAACTPAAAEDACARNSAVCVDAITRGLLSGLQPVMTLQESVLSGKF